MSLRRASILLAGIVVGLQAGSALAQSENIDGDTVGRQIYAQHCASCHGDAGQGGDGFSDPLTGDLSIDELARYVAETMPEGEPELVVGEDAKRVAAYIFDQFYSPEAQIRRTQPRIELAHLTVSQYRNALADLIGSFQRPASMPTERGLQASYFAARRATKSRKISDQIDPQIDFPDAVPHFDPTGKYESVPKPEKPPANQMNVGFSAYWKGGLIAPVTGNYQIKVKSKNGFKLYLNDPATPLIDRYVRSDDVVDHAADIYLLAGRVYHLRLDFFSYPKPPAKIQLLWTPPDQPEQVIPAHLLTPEGSAEVFAVSTPFPPDDASAGYERGIDVSAQWDQATTNAAIEAAQWVADRLERLAGFRAGDELATSKARQFCEQFVQRAFVAHLKSDDIQFYVGQHFDTPELALTDRVKRVVLMTLKSPRFLFRSIENRQASHQIAAQLAETIWDSLPDQALIEAAEQGKLDSKTERDKQLERMVNNFRAQQKLSEFFKTWLILHTEPTAKYEEAYEGFDGALAADLQVSLDMFLRDIAWDEASDYRKLFDNPYVYANRRIADFYGFDLPAEAKEHEFVKVQTNPMQRNGLLTHPYLMTGLAYHDNSSPIHRGVFIAKSILGRQLRQPPNNVAPLTETLAPDMTMRQRVEHQTKDSACMNCHSVINPLGFSLENYDALGRFRTHDDDREVDATAVYRTREGESIELNGPRDLAGFIANNAWAQKNFIRQLFQYYVKQPVAAFGPETLDHLHQRFVEHEFSIRKLIVEIARVTTAAPTTDSMSTTSTKKLPPAEQDHDTSQN